MKTATIKHNDETREDRVTLKLARDDDNVYRWLAKADNEQWQDTGINATSEDAAIEQAKWCWGDSVWDLDMESDE